MPEFAKQITVKRTGSPKSYELLIDGKPFPWHITDDGVRTCVKRDGTPAVTLTIIADNVEVSDSL